MCERCRCCCFFLCFPGIRVEFKLLFTLSHYMICKPWECLQYMPARKTIKWNNVAAMESTQTAAAVATYYCCENNKTTHFTHRDSLSNGFISGAIPLSPFLFPLLLLFCLFAVAAVVLKYYTNTCVCLSTHQQSESCHFSTKHTDDKKKSTPGQWK